MVQANNACNPSPCSGTTSFIETFHSLTHQIQQGAEECCPCA